MSSLHAAVHAQADSHESLVETISAVNRYLANNIPANRFVTLFYAELDPKSGALAFLNAGHNPPVLMRRDGSHERLTEGGIVLGAFPNQTFQNGSVKIQSGDRLVLFTDGVTEAANSEDEEFGDARLIAVLAENRAGSAQHLQTQILANAAQFCANRWQDDATLLILAAS